MRHLKPILVVIVLLGLVAWWQYQPQPPLTPPPPEATGTATASATSLPQFLSAEARHTLALIRQGGPYLYRHDGIVFQNREGRLPHKPRGYYREYTVPTPGARTRGARRIITGGNPPEVYYYTADHYRSFRRFQVPQ